MGPSNRNRNGSGGIGVTTQAGLRSRVQTHGPAAMAMGLAINGLAAYVFLAASGRALGAAGSGQVAVLWATLYLVGTGLFLPFEQELSRSIAGRRARGEPHGALLRQVSWCAGALFAVLAAVALPLSAPLARALFRGDRSFVVALVVGVGGVGLSFVVRGLLAGSGRYLGYAAFYLTDAGCKALPAVALTLAGTEVPLAFAAVAVLSAFVGSVVPLSHRDPRGGTGTGTGSASGSEERWPSLLSALGLLVATALLTAVVLNAGTIAVELLATESEEDQAAVFLSGLVIARIPLFFFQAVQAVVLPRLASSASLGHMAEFRKLLRALLAGIAALTVVAVATSALLGPTVVQVLFGADFRLTGRDMGLLTLSSMLLLAAMTVNQAQIALHDQRSTWWPWALAATCFVVVTAVSGPGLLLRVELGMVTASALAVTVAALVLSRRLGRSRSGQASRATPAGRDGVPLRDQAPEGLR